MKKVVFKVHGHSEVAKLVLGKKQTKLLAVNWPNATNKKTSADPPPPQPGLCRCTHSLCDFNTGEDLAK